MEGVIQQYKENKAEWFPMKVKTRANLHGIWGDFRNVNSDLFAVGVTGTIILYDSTTKTWIPMTSNTAENLNDIWGVHMKNIYAVGNEGTILNYDGSEWSEMRTVRMKISMAYGAVLEKISLLLVMLVLFSNIRMVNGLKWKALPAKISMLSGVDRKMMSLLLVTGGESSIMMAINKKNGASFPGQQSKISMVFGSAKIPTFLSLERMVLRLPTRICCDLGYIRDSTTGMG